MNSRFLVVIVLVLLAWWFFNQGDQMVRDEAVVQKQNVTIVSTPTQPLEPSPEMQPPTTSVQVVEPPTLPEEPYAGPMQAVHFKVEEGLAVAFGDQILGVPQTNEDISEGFNKPPPPKRWQSPEIAYIIHPDLKNPERVEMALQHLRERTVVNFVPFQNQKDAIVFEPGEANCKSYLGRIGGHQPIKLSDTCGWVEILHEIMHALGFVHEHSRTDRDRYVEVLWDFVQDEYKPQFATVTEDMMGPLRGTSFDYQSIMIYPPNLFGKTTSDVTLRSKTQWSVNPSRAGLSNQDIERINRLF